MKKLMTAALVALACSGCVYKGAKVVEGVDVAVGMNVPGSDGALQVQFFNYLSGFRFGLAQNSQLSLEYNCWQTNSFMGISHTLVHKSIKADVMPCEDGAEGPRKGKAK